MAKESSVRPSWLKVVRRPTAPALLVAVALLLLALYLPGLRQPGDAIAAPPGAPEVVARVEAFVEEQVARHGLPGLALGLVHGDEVVSLRGYGAADGSGRPVTPQTPFILASVSKPITALAVMQLVEAGRLELDAPVQRYLPWFRVADPTASAQITPRHLLLHTSGLPATACQSDAPTIEEFVRELQTVRSGAAIGARYEYCSGNYNVLGLIVEAVANQPFGAYVEQHVFAPLGMRHSHAAEAPAREDGLARGHRWLFGRTVPYDAYQPSGLPSGYLIASAEDMARFLAAQLNGGQLDGVSALSPAGIAAMHAPSVATGAGGSYGFGWEVGERGGVPAVSHRGDNVGFHTWALLQPETGWGAILLVNANGTLANLGPYGALEDGIARLLAGQEPSGSGPGLRTLYLAVDAVLLLLTGLVLLPLLRLRRWSRRFAAGRRRGRRWVRLVALRIAGEIAVPIPLVGGVRWLFGQLGAASWQEIVGFVPDLVPWLLAVSALLLLTGLARALLVFRALRGGEGVDAHP